MFLTFGTISSHFWYIILTSMLYIIRYKLTFEDNYQKILSSNPLFGIFSKEIGKTFTFILYLVLWRKKRTTFNKNLNQKKHSLTDQLIITAIIIIITLSNLLLGQITVEEINSTFLKPIFMGILVLIIIGLSMLMLNQKYHRHHLLGLIIFFIGLFVSAILSNNNLETIQIPISKVIFFV